MAKGQTNQPVRILVAAVWAQHPAIQELRAYGHLVTESTDYGHGIDDFDLILHPAAHGWHEAMFEQFTRKNGTPYRPFVDAAVKAGRGRRRATK